MGRRERDLGVVCEGGRVLSALGSTSAGVNPHLMLGFVLQSRAGRQLQTGDKSNVMKTQPGGAFLAGGTGDQRKLRRPTQLPGTGKYVIMPGTKLECSGELAATDFLGIEDLIRKALKMPTYILYFMIQPQFCNKPLILTGKVSAPDIQTRNTSYRLTKRSESESE